MALNFPDSPALNAVFTSGAQSWKWDGTKWVTNSSLPAFPPNDDGEYVMVNGVWRLKSQSFDLVGKLFQDIPVPSWGPGQARLTGFATFPAKAFISMVVSMDGSTFRSGASDYLIAGFTHYTGSAGLQNMPVTAIPFIQVTAWGDTVDAPQVIDTVMILKMGPNGYTSYTSHAASSLNDPVYGFSTLMYGGFTNGISAAGTPIMALRLIFNAMSGGVAPTLGKLDVEWRV
jgi:hypothetical protein